MKLQEWETRTISIFYPMSQRSFLICATPIFLFQKVFNGRERSILFNLNSRRDFVDIFLRILQIEVNYDWFSNFCYHYLDRNKESDHSFKEFEGHFCALFNLRAFSWGIIQ